MLVSLLQVQLVLFSGSLLGKPCSTIKLWVKILLNLERPNALAKPILMHFLSA